MKINSNSDPYEDSGIATSADIHSLEYDGSPIKTPPPIVRKTGTVSSRISTASTTTSSTTLHQHYYPEGGWGWIIVVVSILVQMLVHSLHLCSGLIILAAQKRYNIRLIVNTGWLGGLSTAVALFISPITIAVCKKKSTRLTAVIGGLVCSLGCLFTSFASQFHQLFFSYGAVVGVGVGMTRDCSTLMVAQYFKRKREFVEIFVVSGSGLGLAIMSNFIKSAIDAIGWRLGLQAVTGTIFTTFILGTFYRSASLYHPQRRAILHLKNQKRKIKDKNKQDDGPPFFDYHTLRSKSVRIILISTALSAFGINTPIFYLAHKVQLEGIGDKALTLQTHLGLAWILGCFVFGLLVVRNSMECRIARQYLCQTAIFMCSLCILGLTTVEGNFNGYTMFVWIYGIFCGGYHYSLKMFTYEKVRARNFARAWGFVQCSQATIALGVPITGYLNQDGLAVTGYYFSAICAILGSLSLFLIDIHRRNVSKTHNHTKSNGVTHMCVSDACPQKRKLSFSQEPDNEPGTLSANAAIILGSELLIQPVNELPLLSNGQVLGIEKPELTCISEEGIADMDLPDNLLNDFDDGMDGITSSNRVENYLMMSEFENNLKAETVLSKRNKYMPKTKIVLNSRDLIEHHRDGQVDGDVYLTVETTNHPPNGNGHGPQYHHHIVHTSHENNGNGHSKWKLTPAEGYLGNRGISVIEEASV